VESFQNVKKSAYRVVQNTWYGMVTIEIAGYARDYILPVCIVPLGTMLLVSSLLSGDSSYPSTEIIAKEIEP